MGYDSKSVKISKQTKCIAAGGGSVSKSQHKYFLNIMVQVEKANQKSGFSRTKSKS